MILLRKYGSMHSVSSDWQRGFYRTRRKRIHFNSVTKWRMLYYLNRGVLSYLVGKTEGIIPTKWNLN